MKYNVKTPINIKYPSSVFTSVFLKSIIACQFPLAVFSVTISFSGINYMIFKIMLLHQVHKRSVNCLMTSQILTLCFCGQVIGHHLIIKYFRLLVRCQFILHFCNSALVSTCAFRRPHRLSYSINCFIDN